jgi:hypothetical protein
MIKVRTGQKGQRWQFNCKAEAIVTMENSGNQVLEQESQGRSRNFITTATNLNRLYNKWYATFTYKNEEFVNRKTG